MFQKLRHYKTYTFIAIFIGVAILLTGSSFALPYGSGKYGTCTYDECGITLASLGAVNLNISPNASGVYTIQKDTINIKTGATTGYNVTLSSSSSNTSLVDGGNEITRLSADYSSPQALLNNRWGYRLDGVASFGVGPTSAVTNVATSSLTFAGLQPISTPDTILSTSDASGVLGDNYDIWYGIKADSSLPNGTYSQTLVYTVVQKT